MALVEPEIDDTDYYMLSCVLSDCLPQGDAFATGVVAPGAAAVIVTHVKPYSADYGRPEPVAQELHVLDLERGARIVLGPRDLAMITAMHDVLAEEAASLDPRLAELVDALRRAAEAAYTMASDIDTAALGMIQRQLGRIDRRDVEEYVEDLFYMVLENPWLPEAASRAAEQLEKATATARALMMKNAGTKLTIL